ncbi:GNAT family N-acetyltransferase [Paenibacillus xylanilyticus]|uniref:GNAT family N-acetyltransferase n=1 Tax=Paenibacillus xylanilyticus TaxID=248903 RepID=A0A7Y6C4I3_9BACL|nr:GNAT family N-acetyltransferase [Paenibacillus xylanilyticus]NUU79354.1 GNAT family N-acetyltransferase [Paenibacillus xylanilyticus]
MLIREIQPDDAQRFDLLMKQVEAEADFMLMEPGERKASPEQQHKWLVRMDKEWNSTVLVAEHDGQLVGYLAVIGGDTRRTKHSAYLAIGVLKEYTGRGIGTNLFQKMEEWAVTHNILRLELTVVIQNEAGVSLYKKMGFEIEGIKRNSLMINDTPYDQYFMSKIFSK